MKNITIIALTLLLGMNGLFAQDQIRKVSKLGVMYWKPMQVELPAGYHLKMSVPPITLDYEKEMLPILSFASETGFMKIDLMQGEAGTARNSIQNTSAPVASMYGLFASFGLTAHISFKDVFEPYLKGSLGYIGMLAVANDDFAQNGGFYKSLSAGLNLYLSPRFGLFAEMGLKDSSGTFKVGLVFKR